MAFPQRVVEEAWLRATGGVGGNWAYCECMRVSHGRVPCGKRLAWNNHGRNSGPGCWEANHRHRSASGGPDTVSNCEILCWDCHALTLGGGH